MSRADSIPINEKGQRNAHTCRHCSYQWGSWFTCMCGQCTGKEGNKRAVPHCPACGCPTAEPMKAPDAK